MRYGYPIRNRVCALLKDAHEAEDVIQDTFIAFMRSEALLQGTAAPLPMLYQIATNKAVDRLRRRSRWSGVLGPLEVEDAEALGDGRQLAPSHAGGLARIEALQDLAILTRGEEPETLTAAVLYFVEGWTLEEIAQALGTSRNAVSKLLREFAARARGRGDDE
ncbi:sigma-70 family RNA polymerase sigma factor [Hyalangium sp.]|uniref:RNA polymerase sigma factor n=1 Tax=Hyalangium sp. TaxID=2028555 RepID=UPI002D2897CC|nr:sigma-70 family RNA polymerase sigma factor [Hyalangium sp.]HYH96342.1 sigma-70 family RNA polymerase sigma factor [Hyalangium sp.]